MRQVNQYYCYILASTRNGTLYTGVTSDLLRRVYEHKAKIMPGFSSDYEVQQLVWFETHDSIENALLREKRIKKWNRRWKLKLIESLNPQWDDLYMTLSGQPETLDSRLRGNDGNDENDENDRTDTNRKPELLNNAMLNDSRTTIQSISP
ncbi:GIY-YIG nuclease family protein [Vampirovibrio chlorellavorus]|uniref:GIY-YIG nuclease family protein n=1 Tax=Vampirovibrio chlorellavorus TaxID=758823 RepID=UPI0026EA8A3C|nr:GIY-YIG nuclease family protein [Vampirovibrio chlorellavorus]